MRNINNNDKKIKISFILPVYNAELTCERAISSVLNNNYAIELIIIDDGSKDNTYDVCKQFEKDRRVKLFRQENSGVSIARNMGLKFATGDYIGFIDSDDTLCNNAIEYMMNSLESCPDIVVYGYSRIYQNVRLAGWVPFETKDIKVLFDQIIGREGLNPIWNKLFKRSLIKKSFNPTISMGEDLDFCCDFFKNVSSIVTINKELYLYTTDSNNSLSKRYNAILESVIHDTLTIKEFTKKIDFRKDLYKQFIYSRTINVLLQKSDFNEFKFAAQRLYQDNRYFDIIINSTPYTLNYKIFKFFFIHRLWFTVYVFCFIKRCVNWGIRKFS